jgi:hypothetical protein
MKHISLKNITPLQLATLAVALIPEVTASKGKTPDDAILLATQYLDAAHVAVEDAHGSAAAA